MLSWRKVAEYGAFGFPPKIIKAFCSFMIILNIEAEKESTKPNRQSKNGVLILSTSLRSMKLTVILNSKCIFPMQHLEIENSQLHFFCGKIAVNIYRGLPSSSDPRIWPLISVICRDRKSFLRSRENKNISFLREEWICESWVLYTIRTKWILLSLVTKIIPYLLFRLVSSLSKCFQIYSISSYGSFQHSNIQ